MPTILRRLPFYEGPAAVVVGDDIVAIRPFQIVVWISVSFSRQASIAPTVVRFPAVLDTGHSHNFSIQQGQLQRWGQIAPGVLPILRQARINRASVPLVAAAVWIHPNRPGQRDQFTGGSPFRLSMPRGIAVYPPNTPGEPRLPLLGLRALALNDLHLTIDGKNRRVALRTARRFWLF
jgi:hypothetical protein